MPVGGQLEEDDPAQAGLESLVDSIDWTANLFDQVIGTLANTRVPKDIPPWLGAVPTIEYDMVEQIGQQWRGAVDPEEKEEFGRQYQMAKSFLTAKEEFYRTENEKFLESGLDAEAYARKEELHRIAQSSDILGSRAVPAPVRGVVQGGVNLGGNVISMLSRVLPSLGDSDEHNRFLSQLEGEQTMLDEGNWLASASRRAAGSFVEMSPAGAAGGLGAVIGQAAVSSANQAYTEGIDTGLTPGQAMAYATTTGAIEGGFTWMFSKAGVSMEELLSGAAGRTMGRTFGIRGAAKAMGLEASEESTIAFGQAVLDRVAGVDPEALTPGRLLQRMGESGLAGAMGGGMAYLTYGSAAAEDAVSTVEQMQAEEVKAFHDAMADDPQEVPPTSRRGFSEATGRQKTSESYRESYARASELVVQAKQEEATREQAPPDVPPGETRVPPDAPDASTPEQAPPQPAIEGEPAPRLEDPYREEVAFDPEAFEAENQAAREAAFKAIDEIRAHVKRHQGFRREGNKRAGKIVERYDTLDYQEEIGELKRIAEFDPAGVADILDEANQLYDLHVQPIIDNEAVYDLMVTRGRWVNSVKKARQEGRDHASIKSWDAFSEQMQEEQPEFVSWAMQWAADDNPDSALFQVLGTNKQDLFDKPDRLAYLGEAIWSYQKAQQVGVGTDDDDFFDQTLADSDKGAPPFPKPQPPPPPSINPGEYVSTPAEGVSLEGLDRLVNVPLTELVEMVRALESEITAANLPPEMRGAFKLRQAQIEIARHTATDVDQLKKTVAHEIGHLIDYLPDKTVLRGNLLGRIASLRGYRKKFMAGWRGGPGPLTEDDRKRLRVEAKKLLSKNVDLLIEEEIEEVMPITPDDVKAIWNRTDLSGLPQDLIDYVKRLSTAEKLSIVKEALKGQVAAQLQQFAKRVKTGETRKVKKTVTEETPSAAAVDEKFRDMILEEIRKRKLLSDDQVRAELKSLSGWWRPFDTKTATPQYLKYRGSGVELYADAMSVFLNAPGELQQRAPEFFRGLLSYFNENPDVAREYIDLQVRLQGDPDAISQARVDILEAGYESGKRKIEAKLLADRLRNRSLQEAYYQDGMAGLWKELRDKYGPAVKSVIWDRGAPVLHRQLRAKHVEGPLDSERVNAYQELEKLYRIDSAAIAWVDETKELVHKPLTEAGLSDSDLGRYLQHQRIINDRNEVLNPEGYIPEIASEELDAMRRMLGPEKFAELEQIASVFHDQVFKVAEMAVESGIYSRQLFEEKIEPNRDHYAAFAVLHYLEGKVPWAIREVKGTLESVANPYISSVSKMAVTIRAALLNDAKQKIIMGQLQRDAPSELKVIRHGFKVSQEARRPPEQGNERVMLLDDGQPLEVEVPAAYADLFRDTNTVGAQLSKGLFNHAVYKIFYPLFINYSMSFAARNLIRDPLGTYQRLGPIIASMRERQLKAGVRPEDAIEPLTAMELVRAFTPNLPEAKRRAKGQFDPKINRLMAMRALDARYTTSTRHESHGLFFDQALNEALGLKANEPIGRSVVARVHRRASQFLHDITSEGTRQWFAEHKYWIPLVNNPFIIDTSEAAGKMAGYDILARRGFDDNQIAFMLHNFVGTPNTRYKGQATDWLNLTSMFFSIRMANWRAHGLAVQGSKVDYARRMAILNVPSLVVSKMARYGAFGAAVAYMFNLIPEDEEDRAFVFPLAVVYDTQDGQNKTLYLSLPRDQTDAAAHATLRSFWEAGVETGQLDLSEMVGDFKRETLGTWSPPIDIAQRWIDYGRGRNPVDDYYDTPILSRAEHALANRGDEAREQGPALQKMSAWTISKFGTLADITKPLTAPLLGEPYKAGRDTTLETSLGSAPFMSALVKVSRRGADQHLYEQAYETDASGDIATTMIPARTRSLLHRYNALRRTKDEDVTPDLAAEINRYKWWHRTVYLPFREQMKTEIQMGHRDRAEQIARLLAEVSDASTGYFRAMEGDDATTQDRTLRALQLSIEDSVRRWPQ